MYTCISSSKRAAVALGLSLSKEGPTVIQTSMAAEGQTNRVWNIFSQRICELGYQNINYTYIGAIIDFIATCVRVVRAFHSSTLEL